MKRFKTIVNESNYTIEYDDLNKNYSVFIKCRGFKQQISKAYTRKGWAFRYLNKQLNSKAIKIKEN